MEIPLNIVDGFGLLSYKNHTIPSIGRFVYLRIPEWLIFMVFMSRFILTNRVMDGMGT